MQLERVLIVVEQKARQDGSQSDFDIRHIEGPLKSSEMVDNIDIFYYNDYTPNCDDALINYCLQSKPQAVLLSLQNIALGRERGAPTPDAVRKITHQLNIPTVMFWFDIHADPIAEVLECYLYSVTLNVILGADASSHKPLPLEGTNYIYTGATFDERLFNKPEGERDIPVGFLGSLHLNRTQWIAELEKFGISPYLAGGRHGVTNWRSPVPGWMSYEEYLGLMLRLKIALNFSLLQAPQYQPIVSSDRARVWQALSWLALQSKTWLSALAKNPVKLKYTIPVFKNTTAALLKKPRYMVRARVWEALWCRTFLLEEDNPVTSLYFEPFVDYVPFTTLKDLADKIRYYLENEEERNRIRMQGRATVEKYHNARIYWESLFETIGIPSATQYHHHPGEIWNKAYFDDWYLGHPYIESY